MEETFSAAVKTKTKAQPKAPQPRLCDTSLAKQKQEAFEHTLITNCHLLNFNGQRPVLLAPNAP
jgi:hypothetical protein